MLRWFIFVLIFNLCCCYKILLVFPVPSGSHAILGAGYVRNLIEAGHEVTYIAPVPYDKPHPKLRHIDVSYNFEILPFSEMLNVEKIMTKELDMKDLLSFSIGMSELANATLQNPNVIKFMQDPNQKFDVVVAEWLYTELYCGFAMVFNCPLIWSSSMDAHSLVLWLIDEAPNPAFAADHLSEENAPFGFWTRVSELWIYLSRIYVKWSTDIKDSIIYDDCFRSYAERKGITFVPLNEMRINGAMMLGNSHVSFSQIRKLPENYKSILGYHISNEITALPEDIQKIIDTAEHGVIYFSMGSIVKGSSFPVALNRDLINMFGKLQQTVIWKFDEDIPDLPKNIHVVKWVPQQSILVHPNCKLFITHGGVLSIAEAIHFGVPIISVPLFGDQFLNAHRAVQKGFGRKVTLDMNFVQNLQAAIEDMTNDPRYRESLKEVSLAFRHRAVSPSRELVHWVEHVAVTRGAPHLRSNALRMPFYQKLYIDLAILVTSCISMIGVTIYVLANRGNKLRKVDDKKKIK